MRASAIKNLDHYEHRVYMPNTSADRGFTLERRGSVCTLQLADDFYIRPATSASAWRIVLPDLGVTRVFTIDHIQYAELMKNSAPYAQPGEEDEDA